MQSTKSPGQCVSAYITLKAPGTGSQSVKSAQQIHVTNRATLISMHSHQACVIKIKPLNCSLISQPSCYVLFKKEGRITFLACNEPKPGGINRHIAELKDNILIFATPLPHLISHYSDMSPRWCNESLKDCNLQCSSLFVMSVGIN